MALDKQEWIERLEDMQQANAAFSALPKDQREAIRAATDALRGAVSSLSDGFDLTLSDCRAIDTAFWKMRNAFEENQPNAYQLEKIEAHNLEWDYDTQTWSDVTPSDETVDDWEPHS